MNNLQIDTNLSYCPTTLTVNQPLTITNSSQDQLVFKIKTNKKNLLSMYINHGFIKPFSTSSIPIKIVQKVDEDIAIKLEINWCKATPQMKQKNDSKMQTVSKDQIFKKVFPILRKEEKNIIGGEQHLNKSGSFHEEKSQNLFDSVHESIQSSKSKSQTAKITPFEYDKSQLSVETATNLKQQKIIQQKPAASQQSIFQKFKTQKITQIQSPKKSLGYKQDQFIQQSPQKYEEKSYSNLLPNKNLQIVSEEDEQDHQKELQQIRNQQVQQKRKTDQIRVKCRRINEQIKSSEIIDPKLLLLGLILTYLFGACLQQLIV